MNQSRYKKRFKGRLLPCPVLHRSHWLSIEVPVMLALVNVALRLQKGFTKR